VAAGRSHRSGPTVSDTGRYAYRGTGCSTVAGPSLLVFGVRPGDAHEALLTRPKTSDQRDREAVIRTAKIAADAIAKMSLDDREQVLLRLVRDDAGDALRAAMRE
jgi:hypothetical protein